MIKFIKYLYHLPSHLKHAIHVSRMKYRCKASSTVKLFPSAIINNPQNRKEAIQIDDYTVVLGQLLVLKDSGRIKVGKHAYIGTDTRIWSSDSIVIGDRVFISFGVNIHDYDAHSLSAVKRHEQFTELFVDGKHEPIDDVKHGDIVIEDDAWIGFNASILKGVRIGKGAIVGGCAVVTRNVEAYTIVAGNPAKVVGTALK